MRDTPCSTAETLSRIYDVPIERAAVTGKWQRNGYPLRVTLPRG